MFALLDNQRVWLRKPPLLLRSTGARVCKTESKTVKRGSESDDAIKIWLLVVTNSPSGCANPCYCSATLLRASAKQETSTVKHGSDSSDSDVGLMSVFQWLAVAFASSCHKQCVWLREPPLLLCGAAGCMCTVGHGSIQIYHFYDVGLSLPGKGANPMNAPVCRRLTRSAMTDTAIVPIVLACETVVHSIR